MLGAVLALSSAALFGLNIATARRGVLAGSLFQAIVITVFAGVPLFAIGAVLFGAFPAFMNQTPESIGWFTAAGIVHFVVGRYATYRAARALGAAQSGPVVQTSILVTLALALIFLGEVLTPVRVVGIVLILLGPLIVLYGRRGRGEVTTRAGQSLDYVDGYFWGAVCACAFGVSPILIRLGLGDGGPREAVAAGLTSYSAAAVVVALMILVPRNRADIISLDQTTARWFGATGGLVFASQILLYIALSVAPVTVVLPIQRTSAIFRAVFSWLINRDHEVLGVAVLIGIGLSAAGVIIVTVSTDAVLDLVPLPPGLAEFVRMSWP
jgi:drug/metabolite transporter (DMT)-like permease